MARITATLHEDRWIFMKACRWCFLRKRNATDKNCRENQNTHFML